MNKDESEVICLNKIPVLKDAIDYIFEMVNKVRELEKQVLELEAEIERMKD